MKAYKIEMLVIDFDNLGPDSIGPDSIVAEIENANYPNDCISPKVKKIVGKDIGEWSDDHPLNSYPAANWEYDRLFTSL